MVVICNETFSNDNEEQYKKYFETFNFPLSDFQKYKSLDRLMKNGKNLDSLKPHATTIGLYSGLSLVGIAKLGKPIKITDSYPINFLVKYDG